MPAVQDIILALPQGAALPSALFRAKSAFIQRNFERCGYLKVEFEPTGLGGNLRVAVNFTLPPGRRWHHTEVLVPADLMHEESRIERAFAALDEGIGAARIARLFPPKSAPDADGES